MTVVRARRVGRDDHDRELSPSAVLVVRQLADGGRGDVHARVAEDRADAADHARAVAVAEQREVLLELEVEALAPGLEQVRAVAAARRRADDARALVAR